MEDEILNQLNETLIEINADCDEILDSLLDTHTYDKEGFLKTTAKFIVYKKMANSVIKQLYNSDNADEVRKATNLILLENRYKMMQKCIQDLERKITLNICEEGQMQ